MKNDPQHGRRSALAAMLAGIGGVGSGLALPALAQGTGSKAAPALAAGPAWPVVEAAGKKEAKVVFYHNITPPGGELVVKEFRKEFPGIEVEATRFASAALIERFSTEFSAGRHLADVVLTVPDERIFDGTKAGWMASWVPPEAKNYPASVNWSGRNMLFHIDTAREAIIWNKRRVRPADAPKDWTDLFDPKWKGRIGMNPPWRSVGPQAVVALWEKLGYGDTAAKLKANDVRFFEGSGGLLQAVLRGDIDVAQISDLPLNVALQDGAPLGFVYSPTANVMSLGWAYVAAKAARPNAAKVFVNWLLSARGQIMIQAYAGLPGSRPGIPPLSHLPPTANLANPIDGLTLIPPAKQKQIVDHWRSTFGVL
jgi:iron(III) transport system substrate-binding protein